MKRSLFTAGLGVSLLLLVTAMPLDTVFAAEEGMYMVRVTNLTNAQRFTPVLAATHTGGARLFRPGRAATPELRALAENGDTGPLTALLTGLPAAVRDVGSTSGLLTRGASVAFKISGGGGFDKLSLAAMLIPTNDAFVGLETTLPESGEKKVVYAYACDAGTEQNDELCSSIPGLLSANAADLVVAPKSETEKGSSRCIPEFTALGTFCLTFATGGTPWPGSRYGRSSEAQPSP